MARASAKPVFARSFGLRLRNLRGRMVPPMTATSLAVRAGVSVPYVSQLESGRRVPALASVLALAGVLRCEAWELLMIDPADPRTMLLDAIRERDWQAVDRLLEELGKPSRTRGR